MLVLYVTYGHIRRYLAKAGRANVPVAVFVNQNKRSFTAERMALLMQFRESFYKLFAAT